MTQFDLYAQYYNLLYKDKNYTAEASYVDGLIKQYHPTGRTLLNLGCGTGKHDFAFARLGYTITGIDLSEKMIRQAVKDVPEDIKTPFKFLTGDIRKTNLKTTFDAVISLFHVMSYQITNRDIADIINTSYNHLENGGLFIFDCWYGPGVLTDFPTVRTKQVSNDSLNVTRLAEPVVNQLENTVDVNYTILIGHKSSNKTTEIKETHKMRYLFAPEVELFIENKFKMLAVYEWLTHNQPELTTWNAVFVLQKI